MLHIRPVSHMVAHLLPFGLILPDAFLAFLYKRLYTVAFYLRLTVYAQLLFHL